jgi:small-conductance mechanosensitive channel
VSAPEDASPQTPPAPELPFDPAAIGLPGLPWPMSAPGDFQKALDLIDARLADMDAQLAAANAKLEAATSAAASPVAEQADEQTQRPDQSERHSSEQSGDQGERRENQSEMAGSGPRVDQAALQATIARIEQRMEALQELRTAVQRNATLTSRLAEAEAQREQVRGQAEGVAADDIGQGPPFPVSLLDRLQAELSLKQGVEAVEETRLATAKRRRDAAASELTKLIRERRAARDRLKQADAHAAPEPERAALQEALELARLNDLRAREQLAASERAEKLARVKDDLGEVQQALLAKRIRFVEKHVVLPREALEEQLAKLTELQEKIRAEIETLQRTGDQAEANLYRAQRRLAQASANADQAALSEWVAARQAQLVAARSSVDNLDLALDILSRMRTLWELRSQLMNDPESVDMKHFLRQVTEELAEARSDKESVVERLNALRSIQLAQARRLRDPALGDEVRKAMLARSAAQESAEAHGRELLDIQAELISLLQGMRHQLTQRLEARHVSLQLLQAQETFERWWDAEVLEFDDQSIRVRELVTALAMFVVVLLVVSLIRMGARRALQRRKAKSPKAQSGDLRLALSAIAGNTSQIFVLIAAFYVAMTFSGLASPTFQGWLWTLLVVAFYAQLGIWANAAMLDYFSRRRTRQEMRDPSTVTGYGLLMFFIRVGIWITVGVSLLAYFRYPIAGLVGALGVGSLAVAFAVQNILGDVFSSMAIILDKPFRVGDFIKAGDCLGTIEHIGVKTTRIRSLSGEQIVLSNSDLLNSRIHNFKQFRERRIAFRIGVIYQTPRHLIEQMPGMLRAAVEEVPRTRFDRAHFFEYGDFALTFEIVYYVLSPDYTVYMDAQQAININIHRRFEEAGISFAYPTQELILRHANQAQAT